MHKACCREGYVFCCWTSSFKFLVRAKEEGSVSLLYSRRIQRTLEYFHEVNLQCNIVREIWFATQGVELRCRLVLVEPSGSVPFLTCLVEMERSGAISQNRVFAPDLEPMHSKNLSELNRSCFFHRFCHPAALLMPTKTASSCPVATALCPSVEIQLERRPSCSRKEVCALLVACGAHVDEARPVDFTLSPACLSVFMSARSLSSAGRPFI
jgi:hypothetical protein